MGRMEIIRPVLALIHVGAALIYVAGYVSTKTLSRLAVAEADPTRRRVIFSLGDKFDFRYQIVGGMLVGPSGLLLAVVNGYSLTQAWVALSIVIYAAIVFIGAVLWRGRSIAVRRALDAGEDAHVVWLLTEPRARALGLVELVLLVAIVALMVLRPG
jgi:uncharacterized membrane protein